MAGDQEPRRTEIRKPNTLYFWTERGRGQSTVQRLQGSLPHSVSVTTTVGSETDFDVTSRSFSSGINVDLRATISRKGTVYTGRIGDTTLFGGNDEHQQLGDLFFTRAMKRGVTYSQPPTAKR